MSTFAKLLKLLATCVAAGIVVAGSLFPVVGAFGMSSNKMASSLAATSADLVKGDLPQITTVTDANGEPLAWVYDQQRVVVDSSDIAQSMKLALISMEDRRFLEHQGVDWQGTVRAFLTNATAGEVQQGASSIDQQLIKNFQFLVSAQSESERREAVEVTPARKLREIRMALALDKELPKDEILTKYLNLVSFGNGAFGVQVAAQTYFGVNAKDLSVPQSAMLAGMVQSTSMYNPYINPEATLERRNTIIDAMADTGAIPQADAANYKSEPLGVLERPQSIPNGCITAGSRGFFCDYVLNYLQANGVSSEQLSRGGYTIRTTLDPEVQDSVQNALDTYGQPDGQGVAEVMSVVLPGKDSHKVVAVGSSRRYGLDQANNETVQPQPFSLVGNGAGSVNKIFTVAAAMEKGLGTNSVLPVPARVQLSGFGTGGAQGCPAGMYCVQNAGSYASSLSVTDALAQSPNTTFVNMISQVGVAPTVDMAVRLGLRSYATNGTAPDGQSMANFIKDNNLGSFTLGPEAVNALELSNVGATLASGGVWCPPSPIESIVDANGKPVALTESPCEQVVEEGLANTLAVAMSKDDQPGGTSAAAAGTHGWSLPMSGKTGTTESNRSSAFLGFTNQYASAVYAYNDGTTTTELCTGPLRQCSYGNLFGGREPALTWYRAFSPIATKYGPISLPAPDPEYQRGISGSRGAPNVVGMSQSAATSILESAGYDVQIVFVSGSGRAYGTVVSADDSLDIQGGTITLSISDGSGSGGSGTGGAGGGGAGGAGGAGGGAVGPGGTEVREIPGYGEATIAPGN